MKTIENTRIGGYKSPEATVITVDLKSAILAGSGIFATGEQPGETEDL